MNTKDITTYNLKLCVPDQKDYLAVFNLLADPRMTMYRETDFSIEEVTNLLNDSFAAINNGSVGLRIIKDKNTDEVIGLGGVKKGFLIDHEIYESLIYLSFEYQGKGLGKETLKALMKDAYDQGITRIHAFINMENYNAQFLLESVGFIKQGDETINLNYNIVTRAHYLATEQENAQENLGDMFFVNF